jgi:Cytochrome P450
VRKLPLLKEDLTDSTSSDFNDGLICLVLGLFPKIFAPRAYRGLAALQSAFGDYYVNKYDQEPGVSNFVKKRGIIYRKYGISPIDIGKREPMIQVATANAIASAFFTLVFISQDAVVTEFLRLEIQAAIVITTGKDGRKEAALNVSKLNSLFPLLVSAYHETQRVVNSNIIARRVLEDTIISDGDSKYLLKAGADVQIPAGVLHSSTAIWGPDAAEFNFKRFLKAETIGETAKEVEKERKRGFLPFGGGKFRCPGQYYTFAQILALVAALLVGFDVRSEEGALLQMPEIVRSRLGQGLSRPSKKGMQMGARFIRREGWENVRWKFVQSED